MKHIYKNAPAIAALATSAARENMRRLRQVTRLLTRIRCRPKAYWLDFLLHFKNQSQNNSKNNIKNNIKNKNRLRFKSWHLRATIAVMVCALLGFLLAPCFATLRAFSHGEVWQQRGYDHRGHPQTVVMRKGYPGWTDYKDISKYFIHALLSAEDSRFFLHHGIDIREIWQSLLLNIEKGKIIRGGSTITQQVVKMVGLSQHKTLLRKIREVFGALVVDSVLSKEDILGWYINLVYFGSGAYGIHEAAQYYFDTHPSSLTVAESIHLAMILPGPHIRSRSLREKSLSVFGRKRFKKLLSEMYNSHYITTKQYQVAVRTGNFGSPL